jgi:hypothetical protein
MENSIDLEDLELYLDSFVKDAHERESIERKAIGRAVFQLYLKNEFQRARELYEFAVHCKRWTGPVLWADYVFLKFGRNVVPLARAASLFKRQVVGRD